MFIIFNMNMFFIYITYDSFFLRNSHPADHCKLEPRPAVCMRWWHTAPLLSSAEFSRNLLTRQMVGLFVTGTS